MALYDLQNVAFAYGPKGRRVLEAVTMTLEKGHFYGMIGPNGCGKTTLIDILAGLQRPLEGAVRLDGRRLHAYSRKALARRIALVPQDFHIDFPYSCAEVVMMGRYPHIGRFAHPGPADRRAVEAVFEKTELCDFAMRRIDRLSGGERQRVLFARALAQETDILLLDEATSNLDIHHTLALLNLAAARLADRATVIAVMQDVNLAALYCDRLICLHRGEVFACGPTESVLTAATLKTVFQVDTQVAYHPFSGAQQVVFQKECPRNEG